MNLFIYAIKKSKKQKKVLKYAVSLFGKAKLLEETVALTVQQRKTLLQQIEKELKTLEGEIKRVEGKLGNAGFVAKAPAHVVEEEKAKGEKYAKMLEEVKASLAKLK